MNGAVRTLTLSREEEARLADANGRISVTDLIDYGAYTRRGEGPLLVVVDRDLTMRECGWVFGYADRERQTAAVSTFRLNRVLEPERWQARLDNVIAHELGHLRGLEHCQGAVCLMRLARSPEALDRRSRTACEAWLKVSSR